MEVHLLQVTQPSLEEGVTIQVYISSVDLSSEQLKEQFLFLHQQDFSLEEHN